MVKSAPDGGCVIPEEATIVLDGQRINARQFLRWFATGETTGVSLKRDTSGEIVAESILAGK